jgi:hypothetical protein
VKWTSWLALVLLSGLVAVVVTASLRTGAIRCEVCIDFRGRQVCRSVDGDTEEEALMAARTNACALLASGVTDSMACERTPFASSSCR